MNFGNGLVATPLRRRLTFFDGFRHPPAVVFVRFVVGDPVPFPAHALRVAAGPGFVLFGVAANRAVFALGQDAL